MNILQQDVSDDGRGRWEVGGGRWEVVQGMSRGLGEDGAGTAAVGCATATKCVIIMGDRDKRMATRRTACTA